MKNKPDFKKLHEGDFLISSDPETAKIETLEFSEYLRKKKLENQKITKKSTIHQVSAVTR